MNQIVVETVLKHSNSIVETLDAHPLGALLLMLIIVALRFKKEK